MDLPNGRRADTFDMLIDELQRHWTLISNDYPGVEDVRVIGIDLTRRGIDAKSAKAAKKAKKAAKSSRERQSTSRGSARLRLRPLFPIG